MAAQMRNKQPRPLSIIDESVHDDYPGSDLQVHLPNDSQHHHLNDSTRTLEQSNGNNNGRRLAVAPLQHPVVELTQNDVHDFICDKQPTLTHGVLNVSGHTNNFVADDYGISDQINPTTNEVLLHTTCSQIEHHPTDDSSCQHNPDSRTTSQNSVHKKIDGGVQEFYVDQSTSRSSMVSAYSKSRSSSVEDRLAEIDKNLTEFRSRMQSYQEESNGTFQDESYQTELYLSNNMKTRLLTVTGDDTKDTKKVEASSTGKAINREKKENEHIDKKQKMWKNRMKKSSSFTSSSKKSQPPRRNMNGYDYKSSPPLGRYRDRYLKTEDNDGQKMSGNSKEQFYLSSELNLEQENNNSISCVDNSRVLHEDNTLTLIPSEYSRKELEKESIDIAKQSLLLLTNNSSKKEISIEQCCQNITNNSSSSKKEISTEQCCQNITNNSSSKKEISIEQCCQNITNNSSSSKKEISIEQCCQNITNNSSSSKKEISIEQCCQNKTEITTESLQKQTQSIPTNHNTLSNSANQSNIPSSMCTLSKVDQSDLSLLKTTATRLNLRTRRPSIQIWKAQYLDNETFHKQWDRFHNPKDDHVEEYNSAITYSRTSPLTVEKINRINESLTSIRQELIGIRVQDQTLAHQLLSLRHKMNELRLTVECQGHQQLLDQANDEVEELRELSRLVDIPPELLSPLASLQHLGLTRMNLSSRRFSTC